MRRLFLDMDGVFADFDRGYAESFGHECLEVDDSTMWATINTKRDTFFRELPVMPGAVSFYEGLLLRNIEPIFLTACPESNFASVAAQKKAWIKEHVNSAALVIPVMHGRNKHHYLQNEGDILIDDFPRNIERWNKAGGVGLLHKGEEDFRDHRLYIDATR